MKTKEEKKKSNLWFMLLVLFLISVILCISSFGIATWARYRTVTGSNVEAQIAKWSFKVNGEEEQFADINLADTIDFTHVTTDKIAPGTYGSFDLDIDGRGSEVSLDYYVDMVVAQKPTNMKFYSDSNYTQAIELAVGNKMYLEGDLLLSENPMQETRTIYWKWDYRTNTLPSEAVLNAYSSVIPGLETLITDYTNATGNSGQQEEIAMKINDKIDTQEAGGQVIVNVKVRGVQINPNFSLKRVQVTSAKDDVYQAGDTVNFSMEFTENVYGNNSTGAVTNVNAPVVTVGFGGATANNPVAKVASLMQTNLKLSAGEKIATFVSVNENKINYSYTLQSGDSGAFRIASITGSVYNSAGKQINFGTIQSVPEVMGGTVTTEAPVVTPIGIVTPVGNVTPTPNTPAFPFPSDAPTPTPNPSYNSGRAINWTTMMNNVVLNDWRLFYEDNTNGVAYLIYGGYLPVSALDTNSLNSGNVSTFGNYAVDSDNRINLVNYMLNRSNWSNMLKGYLNGVYYDYSNDLNYMAQGAPTFEFYANVWATKNSAFNYTGNEENGYYFIEQEENSDGLFYPYKSEFANCNCYWLASKSVENNQIMRVGCDGYVSGDVYEGNDHRRAFRPIISIPLSLIE